MIHFIIIICEAVDLGRRSILRLHPEIKAEDYTLLFRETFGPDGDISW
jgi:hypothetical protein